MSLRARLLSAAILAALMALALFGTATYSALRAELYAQVDGELYRAAGPITATLLGSPILYLPPTYLAHEAPGMYVAVYADGQVTHAFALAYVGDRSYGPALSGRLAVPASRPALWFNAPAQQANGPEFRVQATVLASGYDLILATPLTPVNAVLDRLLEVELAVAALALVAAGALGWWLVHVGLKPLQTMESATAAISAGELNRRVPEPSPHTELGRLARSFNLMLDRIQDAFERRDATEARLRQFVADASHELRTPVAAVKAYAELFSRGAERRPEDLARVMRGIERESTRMGALVEDLLLLARLDEGRPLEREPVEMVKLVLDAAEAARLVGPDWPVAVEAKRPVEVLGDPTRLRQVVDNLLANVRAHTPPGTKTRVVVREEGRQVEVAVVDNGPGLPPEAAHRVFERFFRAEAARTRRHGGTGLGLAIVAALVEAHGGAVGAENEPGGGARFWFRLPRYEPENGDDGIADRRGR